MQSVLVACLIAWVLSLVAMAWVVWRAPIIEDFDLSSDHKHPLR